MQTEAGKAKKVQAARNELAKVTDRRDKAKAKADTAKAEAERCQAVATEYDQAVAKATAHVAWVESAPTSDGPAVEQPEPEGESQGLERDVTYNQGT